MCLTTQYLYLIVINNVTIITTHRVYKLDTVNNVHICNILSSSSSLPLSPFLFQVCTYVCIFELSKVQIVSHTDNYIIDV